MAAEPKWLTLARAEIGTHEMPGEHDNPAILAYYKDAGHADIRDESVPWCAGFVCAMLERAGEHSPKTLSARDMLRWGKKLDKPRLGCVVVFSRGDPRAYTGHTGFYAGEEDGFILLLAGNQGDPGHGDEVSIKRMPKARLLGYRWPVQAKNSTTTKSVAAGVAAAASTAAAAATTVVSAVPQIAATSPDQALAIGGEFKTMAHYAPMLGLIGSIIVVVALGCIAYAHWRDLTKNGK
jgi:uncharacterized protein (TIGR02594 family)